MLSLSLGGDMRRREFISLLGGTAVWPLIARAQQPERMRRIGVLLPATADDPDFQTRVGAFLQALALLGWTIGRNVRIDTRCTTTNAADIRRHAAELAALAPDVILAYGTSTVGPLLQATPRDRVAMSLDSCPTNYGRKMAGAAQRDRAQLDARGGASGPHSGFRKQPVCCYPGHGAIAQAGGETDQRARGTRDQARRRRLCARSEWRSDTDAGRGRNAPGLRWFWSIIMYVNPKLGIATSGRAPCLDESQFLSNWQRCSADSTPFAQRST
jgi:hypothetical protein